MTLILDSAIARDFGPYGQQTVRQMEASIKQSFKGECRLVYNEKEQTFTIWNSQETNVETIRQIFSQNTYEVWKPVVKNKTDHDDNKIVKLAAIVEDPNSKVKLKVTENGLIYIDPFSYQDNLYFNDFEN